MRNRIDVAMAIDYILLPYADCFAWEDYGPKGNPCWDPYDYASEAEEEEGRENSIVFLCFSIAKTRRYHLLLRNESEE